MTPNGMMTINKPINIYRNRSIQYGRKTESQKNTRRLGFLEAFQGDIDFSYWAYYIIKKMSLWPK